MKASDGSIRAKGKAKNGKTRWEVTVSLGIDPATGKYRRVSRSIIGTKADAKELRDELRRKFEGGLKIDADRVTFSEFAHRWYEQRKGSGEIATGTLRRDAATVRRIGEYIGSMRLADITPEDIDSLYLRLRHDRGISASTIRRYHAVLSSVFRKAVDYDLILRSPIDKVKPPKAEDPDRRSLDESEAARLFACIVDAEEKAYRAEDDKEARQLKAGNLFGRSYIRDLTNIGCAIGARLALVTGARRGELCGLTWEHVGLESGTIGIRASYTASGELKAPKTKSGNRVVAIDAATVSALRTWQAYQARELHKVGVVTDGNTPVICNASGGFVHPDNFSRWWLWFRDEYGFPGLRMHELRHTWASLAIRNGTPYKTVQEHLGHASIALTLDWYTHSSEKDERAAADLMGGILSSGTREARIIDLKTA